MPHAIAMASRVAVMTQHPNSRPIKGHSSPDWLKGVKHSLNPTLRKNIGPASRDERALTPLGHAGGLPARDQRVAERADEPSSDHRPWIADDQRQRLSLGSSGNALATRQRRI